MNRCRDAGALVGLEHELPEDPHAFHLRGMLSPVGCNQLRCELCQEYVTSRSGWAPGEEFDPAVAYGQNVWRTGKQFLKSADGSGRLYLCRCTWWLEYGLSYLDSSILDVDQDRPPWACAGHAATQPPVTVDGIKFASSGDVAMVIERALRGWAPQKAPPESNKFPGAWLNRAYGALFGTELADTLSRAVAGALTADDPLARAAALHFLTRYPLAAGSERLLAIAAEHRALYRDIEDPTTLASLELNLLRTLGLQERAHRVRPEGNGGRPGVIETLRSVALTRDGFGAVIFPVLAEFDADWLIAHARAVAGTEEDQVELLDWVDIYAPDRAADVHAVFYG